MGGEGAEINQCRNCRNMRKNIPSIDAHAVFPIRTVSMLKKFTLALAFFAVLIPLNSVAASSQVAVILFFCSIAAVVPGPWQQPLLFISSFKDTLLPAVSFFVLRLLLAIVAASWLQKLLRVDALKFGSLSGYAVPAMSLALLVDHSTRQSVIDALSLTSATSYFLNAFYSVLPASFLSIVSRALKSVKRRWTDMNFEDAETISESNYALFVLLASIVAFLVLLPFLWAPLKKHVMSLNSVALQAILISQLSATFILPLVPDLRSSVGCVLCVFQLLIAPYIRPRSLPFPSEKNRRMFIVCVIPIAMAYSSEGVELSVLIQAMLDLRVLVADSLNRIHASDSSNVKHSCKFSVQTFSLCFLIIVLVLGVVYCQVAASYVSEIVARSYVYCIDLNLTFISMFVLTWGANYDAGFPSMLVVVMTLLLPSLKG
jgi:hypothetical protein